MKYIKRYNTYNDLATAETVTATEEYVSSIIPGVAGIREDTVPVWYNQVPSNKKMTIEELIAGGYAEIMQDSVRAAGRGTEVNWNVIQIHPNCPIKLSNITDFDDYLTSATTFVWREELPNGWNPSELASKYNSAQLARPLSPEIFPCVDLSGVDELTLSFAGASNNYTHSSIISQRYAGGGNYYPNITFKTPKHLTVNIRGYYSSVAQTHFSMLNTTTGLTINCADMFDCHDVTGLFEHNPNLEELIITGPWSWGSMLLCHLLFNGDNNLKSIPWSNGWGWTRESSYNTIYPHKISNGRGSANCGGIFNAHGLEYIGPRLNMFAMSLNGCVVDGVNQSPLPYFEKGAFYCPNCTDVRIININNNDWNFADNSTYTYLPKIDVASIEYILNNAADCSSTPHTVTFSTLHQGEISASAISAAAAKGWTVAFQAAE